MIIENKAGDPPHHTKQTMKALGKVTKNDTNQSGSAAVAASGGRMTFTRAGGLGKSMVSDLDFVKARYARVKAIENREAAREAAAERRALKEARAFANLDTLISEIQEG